VRLMATKAQPIRWTSDTFTVVDANQTVASALLVIRKSPASWVVVGRHDSEGTHWYVYSNREFVSALTLSNPVKQLTQALSLSESTASFSVRKRSEKIVPPRLPKGTPQPSERPFLRPAPLGRVVLLDQKRQRIIAIGTAPVIVDSMKFGAANKYFIGTGRPKTRVAVKRHAPHIKTAAKSSGRYEPVRRASKLVDTVQVMFATDRAVTSETAGSVRFSNARSADGAIKHGICEVSIPVQHVLGRLESPSLFRLQIRSKPGKHIILTRSDVLSAREFAAYIRRLVTGSTDKDALVFVPGFNVSFEDGARRTAQIAYDLKFKGAPILYSWPSKGGGLLSYTADEAAVEVSAKRFAQLLQNITRSSGAEVVHVIAHSMGNRALLLALEQLATSTTRPKINNVILTAPDIDVQRFYQIADAIRMYPVRTTLYASSKDKALRLSRLLHRYPRAGESGDNIVITPGVDSVDASSVDTNLFSLGHSYFSKKRTVLSDISDVLEGKPPGNRFQLTPRTSDRGQYWAFRP